VFEREVVLPWVRRPVVLSLAALAGVLLALGFAVPRSVAQNASGAHSAKLSVGVEVLGFQAAGRKLTGTGLVTARLADGSGHVDTTHTRVAVTAAAGTNCRVLYLYLQQLNLQLLGLTAHLDKVQLSLTGDPAGGVLGRLFCQLAKAKVSLATRASAARAMDASLRHHNRMLRFSADLHAQTASSTSSTCQVLSLVLGPLDLQLLGLVVDLNKVNLQVTATRGQGALGDLFCGLADNSTTPTTTTPTTPTTTTPASG
jgi:hypothetical protein